MLLSIIIPMYNAEHYVNSCLDSIIGQQINCSLYEIIIVNDGSSDNSCELVRQYQKKYQNIYLYSQENKGQSVARNNGMQKARGKFIQFIDIDDLIIPNSLSQIVNFAMRGNALSYDMITFGINGGDPLKIHKNRGTGRCVYVGNGYEYISRYNYNNGPWYYWINRNFIDSHNLHFEEGKLCEDGIFTLTALLSSKKIALIDSEVYFYAVRPNSTTTTTNNERLNKMIEGLEFAVNYFNKMIELHNNMLEQCKKRILNRRDSYAFFLFVRILKMGRVNIGKEVINRLNSKNIYPLKNFPGSDYPSKKIKIITKVINNKFLYLALCKFINIIKR